MNNTTEYRNFTIEKNRWNKRSLEIKYYYQDWRFGYFGDHFGEATSLDEAKRKIDAWLKERQLEPHRAIYLEDLEHNPFEITIVAKGLDEDNKVIVSTDNNQNTPTRRLACVSLTQLFPVTAENIRLVNRIKKHIATAKIFEKESKERLMELRRIDPVLTKNSSIIKGENQSQVRLRTLLEYKDPVNIYSLKLKSQKEASAP